MQILEQQPGSLPKTRYACETSCMRCGHCMAVCTNEALLLEGTRREELEPLEPAHMPSPEALRALLRGRRSIRLYKDELVERSVIECILDTARWAPSGKNVQPLRYTVSSGKERMKEISEQVIAYFRSLLEGQPELAVAWGASGLVKAWDVGKDVILRGAPQLIAAHGPRGNPVLVGSGTIALTQIELLAAAHGLGACWAGYVQIAAGSHEPTRKALGLPAADALAGALMLGKPRVKYHAVVPRNPLNVVWR